MEGGGWWVEGGEGGGWGGWRGGTLAAPPTPELDRLSTGQLHTTVQCFLGGLIFEAHVSPNLRLTGQLKTHGPSRTCDESKEEEKKKNGGKAMFMKLTNTSASRGVPR